VQGTTTKHNKVLCLGRPLPLSISILGSAILLMEEWWAHLAFLPVEHYVKRSSGCKMSLTFALRNEYHDYQYK